MRISFLETKAGVLCGCTVSKRDSGGLQLAPRDHDPGRGSASTESTPDAHLLLEARLVRDSFCRPLAGTELTARYQSHRLEAVVCHCGDGDLSIDNNGTERSLRGFAIGRNNWTFFGSDRGGKTAAFLRSFVTCCGLVKIDPFAWFRDVLSRIADHPVKSLEELMPHQWSPATR
jgi:hypothetical protein